MVFIGKGLWRMLSNARRIELNGRHNGFPNYVFAEYHRMPMEAYRMAVEAYAMLTFGFDVWTKFTAIFDGSVPSEPWHP